MKKQLLRGLGIVLVIGLVIAAGVPLLFHAGSDTRILQAQAEMTELQSAVKKLLADAPKQETVLQELGKHGFWELFQSTHPTTESHVTNADYETDSSAWWKGPYLRRDNYVVVAENADIQEHCGQPEAQNGYLVPVKQDPWGGYYRVLVRPSSSPIELVLVCTGPDRKLETTPEALGKEIKPLGDDLVSGLK